jgi:ArsR family transcriptional regulator
MISLKEAAQGFAAVGSESRLAVLLLLVKTGVEGLTVGEIGQHLRMPASTLAHHLRFLGAANLIEQEKKGREVINKANFDHVKLLGDYLLDECCMNEHEGDPNEIE